MTETVESVGSAVVHACAEPERGAPATHVSLRIAGLGSLLVRRGATENRGPPSWHISRTVVERRRMYNLVTMKSQSPRNFRMVAERPM